MLVVTGLYSIL
jgi:hypothetical protein